MPKKSVEQKLDLIIKEQKKQAKLLKSIADDEKAELSKEDTLTQFEAQEVDELKKLELLEKDIDKSMKVHPLAKITYKDATKAAIGAFVGIISHFTFTKAPHVGHEMDLIRASMLLVLAYILCTGVIYYSGFRKVKQAKFLQIIPIRSTVVFVIALATILLVFSAYGVEDFSNLSEVYKATASLSIIACLGASAADMVGRDLD